MTDFFALVNEPRRPWLDPELLKQKFLAASAGIHPDRVHHLGPAERAKAQEQYTGLNAAYNCLREPKERLRHLLELELGAISRDIQRVPSVLMDLSLEIGAGCRHADAVLAEKEKADSPLLKVQFFERSQEAIESLQALQKKVNALGDGAAEELKRLDRQWNLPDPAARPELLRHLEDLHRLLGYIGRWNAQIQERIARLAF